MNERELRSACARLLRALDVSPPLDMVELCGRVAELRDRPIVLVEHPLTSGLALSWNAGDYDVIAWRPHTSPWHRDHSIAHELGHCLCGHIDPDGDYSPRTVAPEAASVMDGMRETGLSLDDAYRRPHCSDSPHEITAERIATTLLQWSCVPGRAPSVGSASRGLARTLAWRRGWL